MKNSLIMNITEHNSYHRVQLIQQIWINKVNLYLISINKL